MPKRPERKGKSDQEKGAETDAINIMAHLSLSTLGEGMPGLTASWGNTMAEAAAVCLENRNHRTGVPLHRSGSRYGVSRLEWDVVDDQCRACHADLQDATEWGACGIAILIAQDVSGKVVVERSRKGTGFDFWLGDADGNGFYDDGTVRLEVSGILTGTPQQINTRVRQKKAQMSPTDGTAPGVVAVVEFGRPCVRLERHE